MNNKFIISMILVFSIFSHEKTYAKREIYIEYRWCFKKYAGIKRIHY